MTEPFAGDIVCLRKNHPSVIRQIYRFPSVLVVSAFEEKILREYGLQERKEDQPQQLLRKQVMEGLYEGSLLACASIP